MRLDVGTWRMAQKCFARPRQDARRAQSGCHARDNRVNDIRHADGSAFDALRIVTFVEATGDGEPCASGGAGDASLVQRHVLESTAPVETSLMLLIGAMLTIGAFGCELSLGGHRQYVLSLPLLIMLGGGMTIVVSQPRLGFTPRRNGAAGLDDPRLRIWLETLKEQNNLKLILTAGPASGFYAEPHTTLWVARY
jgi:hypothetical protein